PHCAPYSYLIVILNLNEKNVISVTLCNKSPFKFLSAPTGRTPVIDPLCVYASRGPNSFQKRHCKRCLMHHRPVAEIAAFTESLAMVRHDHEVRVRWRFIEQASKNLIHIFHTADLLRMQEPQLLRIKEAGIVATIALAVGDAAAGILTRC